MKCILKKKLCYLVDESCGLRRIECGVGPSVSLQAANFLTVCRSMKFLNDAGGLDSVPVYCLCIQNQK